MDCRRLACAVRAEQPQYLSRPNRKGHSVDSGEITEAFLKVTNFQDRRGHSGMEILLKGKKVLNLIRQVARLAFPIQHSAFMLRFAVMAAETVVEGSRVQIGSVRIVRVPGLVVRGHMPSWNDNRIAFNRLIVHHTGMARRTTLTLASGSKRLHVLSMTHDQSHLLDRRGQISRRHFGCPKDMLMTAQTDVGINLRFQVRSIGRCTE